MNLLGLIVEEHTGQKLETLVDELVFAPLGMKRSGMIWRKEFEDAYAFGYDKNQTLIGAQKRTSSRAVGSMVTTAADYAQFVMASFSDTHPIQLILLMWRCGRCYREPHEA